MIDDSFTPSDMNFQKILMPKLILDHSYRKYALTRIKRLLLDNLLDQSFKMLFLQGLAIFVVSSTALQVAVS